jgi:acetyl-CoA/propionyl-CoA carboxylase biotin carboxyl carrier protein
MIRALGELEVEGIKTTAPAHLGLLAHPDFAAGNHSTKWVEDELDPSVYAGTAVAAAPPAVTDEDSAADAELVERTVPVEVDGKRFSVRVWLPDAPVGDPGGAGPRRVSRPRPAAGSGGGAGDGTVTAPMQGTIVKTLVSVGDAVESGQAVLVLEAMKMENHINAEQSGTVAEIRVAAGDQVGTGDVLIVID